MIEQLVVVEYFEGAGGEFFASFINAHWGQSLVADLQKSPDPLQKWLNSHSLVKLDWDVNFEKYALKFFELCKSQKIEQIAVPYHLYKWPKHQEILNRLCYNTRYVRINAQGYEQKLAKDFDRKVLNRVLDNSDFMEIKFLLNNKPKDHRIHCINLFRQHQLTLAIIDDRFKVPDYNLLRLCSQDIEISYKDFFIDFDATNSAYQQLCQSLNLNSDNKLLTMLIDRNRKNLHLN